jgi:hypothetical protein
MAVMETATTRRLAIGDQVLFVMRERIPQMDLLPT